MNWLTVSQEGDVCAICIDNYNTPVNLTCHHSFCIECLKLVMKKVDAKFTITCPLCEKITDLGNDDKLATLPVNVELQTISDKKRKERGTMDESEYNERLRKLNSTSQITIPRNIKLLQEYDASIGKDGKTFIPLEHTGFIGYGVQDEGSEDFQKLTNWTSMIIGPQDSPIGQVIYNLRVVVPDEYPVAPPVALFTYPKVKMDCVDDAGIVDISKIELVDITHLDAEGMAEESLNKKFAWNPNLNIADVLVALRNNMHLKSVCKDSSGLHGDSY